MPTITTPELLLKTEDVGVVGVDYGEFALRPEGEAVAPFRAARFSIAPGRSTPRDAHEARECWFVAEGEGSLHYEGEAVPVRAGQFLFFESCRAHALTNTGACSLVILSLWWPNPAGCGPRPARDPGDAASTNASAGPTEVSSGQGVAGPLPRDRSVALDHSAPPRSATPCART